MENEMKADVVKSELQRIYDSNGVLTPPLVVEEAKPKDAPLHPCFEWDNKRAGEEYRLYQARHLIRTVTVTSIVTGKKAPAWFNVPATTKEEAAYHPAEVIAKSEDMTQRAVSMLAVKNGISVEGESLAEAGSPNTARIAQIGQALATAKELASKIF